jgi:hypothetical protein
MPAFNFKDPVERAAALEYQKEVLRIRIEARKAVAAEDREPITFPPAVTLTQLLEEPDEDTPWRIVECQPKGSRVICAAQFKAGKTTLVGNVIRSLVDGHAFLGKYDVVPVDGTVALLDFEMSRTQLKRWYREQQITNTNRVVVLSMRGYARSFNLADAEVRAYWVKYLRDRHVVYLILDPLRPILDALGLDEHHDVGAFLVPLDQLLTEAGIADALIVHHMGHVNERSRGDSRLRDWPDVEWRLIRKDEDPASARFFTAYGRDVDVKEQQLSHEVRRLTVVGGSRRDAKIEEALPVVLACIGTENAAGNEPSRNDILNGLKESGHTQAILKAAITLGITQKQIVVRPGPRKAQLHSLIPDPITRTEARTEAVIA